MTINEYMTWLYEAQRDIKATYNRDYFEGKYVNGRPAKKYDGKKWLIKVNDEIERVIKLLQL